MGVKRTQHTAHEKAKLALEVLRGERTVNEIAAEHDVHPKMLSRWKREAEEGLHTVYENETSRKRKEQQEHETMVSELYTQIGKLTTQVEWLKKKSGIRDE